MKSLKLGIVLTVVILLALGCREQSPQAEENPAGKSHGEEVSPPPGRPEPVVQPEQAPTDPKPTPTEAAEPAAKEPVESASPNPPALSAPNGEKRSDWPGVTTDLGNAPALYLGRMTANPSPILRKPKYPTDLVHPLNDGHIVEVLAEEGPVVDIEGTKGLVIPARIGPYLGWVMKSQLEKLDTIPYDRTKLWGLLQRSALAGPTVPEDGCTAVIALMDLTPSPGDEAVSYALGGMGCDTLIGVFENPENPTLVASIAGERIQEIRFVRQEGAENLLAAHTHWHKSPQHSGERHRFLGWSQDKLATRLGMKSALFDTRVMPAKYETSTFAYPVPKGGGTPYIQHNKVSRTIAEGGKETIAVSDTFYRWQEGAFVQVIRPAEAVEFPTPKPSMMEFKAEVSP